MHKATYVLNGNAAIPLLWRLSALLPFLWRKASVVVASTCVRVRSCVRCRRRGSRNSSAERQGTLLSLLLPVPLRHTYYYIHTPLGNPPVAEPRIYPVHRPQSPYQKGGQTGPYSGLVRALHSPRDMAEEDVPVRSRHGPASRVRKEPLMPP